MSCQPAVWNGKKKEFKNKSDRKGPKMCRDKSRADGRGRSMESRLRPSMWTQALGLGASLAVAMATAYFPASQHNRWLFPGLVFPFQEAECRPPAGPSHLSDKLTPLSGMRDLNEKKCEPKDAGACLCVWVHIIKKLLFLESDSIYVRVCVFFFVVVVQKISRFHFPPPGLFLFFFL